MAHGPAFRGHRSQPYGEGITPHPRLYAPCYHTLPRIMSWGSIRIGRWAVSGCRADRGYDRSPGPYQSDHQTSPGPREIYRRGIDGIGNPRRTCGSTVLCEGLALMRDYRQLVVAGLPPAVVAGLPTEPPPPTAGLPAPRRPAVGAAAGSGDPRQTGDPHRTGRRPAPNGKLGRRTGCNASSPPGHSAITPG